MTTLAALLLGDDVFPWHGVHERGPEIDAALGDAVDCEVTTDRRRLLDLEGFDVFVDYTSDSTLAAGELDALLSFVEGGGGYLGVHCAADLTSTHDGDGGIDARDEPFPELRAFLGGHFLDHPEQSSFGVDVVDSHPVTAGVDDFEVFDEPYQVDCDEDAVTVLARMDHPDAAMEADAAVEADATMEANAAVADYPIVWVREYGQGRICYSSLGHTTDAFEHDAHRRLLRNAIEYVTDAERGA